MNSLWRVMWAGLVAAALLPGQAWAAGEAKRPNIIFILADDLGWMDTSLYGSKFYRTPNIDRLARRGMMFTDAYAAAPICSPTRASILTGQYPARLRLTTPAGHLKEVVLDPTLPERGPPAHAALTPGTRTRLPLDYRTIAELLQGLGYATCHIGKWHLGWPPYGPANQGFDTVIPGGSHPGPPSYFAPYKIDGFDGPQGEHITDRLTEEAVKYIKKQREGPFFLNFWHYSVHAPFQAKEDLVKQYAKRADPNNPQRNPVMGSMIQTLDESVGRILDAVDESGIGDDTIIIFLSDNGGNMYNVVGGTFVTSNAPLRAGKGTLYEGGTRVPMIVVWPGRAARGSRSGAVVSSVDWYPTLAEMAGGQPKQGQVLDGVSLVPVLTGAGALDREAIFCHFPHYAPAAGNVPGSWVRRGDWKLLKLYADGPKQADRYELYNLRDDVGESKNLAAEQPDRVRELDALLARHLRETDALVPRANPAYRPTVAGFSGSKDTTLSLGDGCLRLRSTGNDPYLTTREVPKVDGPVALELRLKSAGRGEGRVYWRAGKAAFAKAQSAGFEPRHDGQWHDYTVKLAVQGKLTELRLDPATGPGEVEIQWLRLRTPGGVVVREWDFRKD